MGGAGYTTKAGSIRSLLAEFTPLAAGEAVSVLYPGPGRRRYAATVRLGLYPIVTLQYISTTLYQVSYHIR